MADLLFVYGKKKYNHKERKRVIYLHAIRLLPLPYRCCRAQTVIFEHYWTVNPESPIEAIFIGNFDDFSLSFCTIDHACAGVVRDDSTLMCT